MKANFFRELDFFGEFDISPDKLDEFVLSLESHVLLKEERLRPNGSYSVDYFVGQETFPTISVVYPESPF